MPCVLVVDEPTRALWGLAGAQPAPVREPSRIANLRKRRERIRATLRTLERGGTVDVRQERAVDALPDIEAALAAFERCRADPWLAPPPSAAARRDDAADGEASLVDRLWLALTDFTTEEQARLCGAVARCVLAPAG